MTALTLIRACAVLALLLLQLMPGCSRDSDSAKTGSAPLAGPHAPLSGGDDQAWLNGSGSLPGSSYCDVALKLPLAKDPAWEYTYTPAELADRDAWQILHYDGRLVVSTRGPQMAVLDARNGQKIFSQDLYARDASESDREFFDSILLSTSGRLLGMDDLGRYYCWSIEASRFRRIWLGEKVKYGRAGLLAGEHSLVSGSDDVIYGADLETGKPSWRLPATQPNSGLVLDSKGRALCWTTINEVSLIDTSTGKPLWSYAATSQVDSCTINEWLGCFYLVFKDESMECRSLDKGELLWSYGWSGFMDAGERKRRAEAIDWPGVSLAVGTTCSSPAGVVLQMLSGDVIFLDSKGALYWHRSLGTGAFTALAFPNGVMVVQAYSKAVRSLRPSRFDPFNLEEPDWQSIQNAAAAKKAKPSTEPAEERGGRTLWFTRVAVLSLEDGSELDSFEPDVIPISGLTPACGNIVFGGTRDLEDEILSRGGMRGAVVRRIRAYNWLQSEAN